VADSQEKVAIKLSLKFLPPPKHVATLPCEKCSKIAPIEAHQWQTKRART